MASSDHVSTAQLGAGQVLARLGRFVLTMFRPHIYATYGILWTLALEGSAVLLSGTAPAWAPSWGTAVRVTSVVLALLFMRMLDEQKDLDYDRVYNPDRPLVTGAIRATELRGAMLLIAILVAGLNAMVSAESVLLVLAGLGYGLLLVVLERWSARIRDSLIWNLLVTYPVQLVLSGYVYRSLVSTGVITADWRVLPLLTLFACVFLHFEFARKTMWRGEPGARLYSSVLGPVRSAGVAIALAAAAGVLALMLFRPWHVAGGAAIVAWAPCLTPALAALGGWSFLLRRRPSWPLAPAMCFVLGMFVSLVAQAAAR